MFSSQPVDISLGVQCRNLAAVRADKVDSRFLVGSNSVQQSNHLFLLSFHTDANEICVDVKVSHDTGPVTAMCTSPTEASVVVTAADKSSQATLWKIPPEVMQPSSGPRYRDEEESERNDASSRDFHLAHTESMEVLTTLDAGGSDLVDIVWRDAGEESVSPGDVLTIDRNGRICQWDIGFGQADQIKNVKTSDDKVCKFPPRVAWDPHGNGNSVAYTKGPTVGILDWRIDTSIPSGTVDSFVAHRYAVTDLDYNSNKPFVLATAGQDSLVKFWDLRSAKQPLLVARGGHSHWAYKVKYNPFHDQLVLSSGTDSMVNLWRCSTISSAPLMTFDDNDDEASDTSSPNVRVDRYEHNDSVYGLCWGAADAWMYMSLGYDGKVVASHVPSKEKYKILL